MVSISRVEGQYLLTCLLTDALRACGVKTKPTERKLGPIRVFTLAARDPPLLPAAVRHGGARHVGPRRCDQDRRGMREQAAGRAHIDDADH